jgi:hypothetical protein
MHIVTTVDSRNIQIKNDNNRFQNYQDDELNFRQDTPKRFSFGEKDRPKDFRFGEHDDRDGDIETRNYHDRRGGGNRRNFRGRGRSGGDHYNENRADHYNRQESRNSNEEYYDKRDFRNRFIILTTSPSRIMSAEVSTITKVTFVVDIFTTTSRVLPVVMITMIIPAPSTAT